MSDRSERMSRSWGKSWGGTVEGDGAMGGESYEIESYKVESGANKKRASKISLQNSLK